MTLADAGPLVALLDRRDPYHPVAVAAATRLPAGPLVTSWPCVTEAMYLLGRAAGWAGQAELWGWVADGRVVVREAWPGETARMGELMARYRDLPMDLADASLVAAAEAAGWRRVFTLDRHFRRTGCTTGRSWKSSRSPGRRARSRVVKGRLVTPSRGRRTLGS